MDKLTVTAAVQAATLQALGLRIQLAIAQRDMTAYDDAYSALSDFSLDPTVPPNLRASANTMLHNASKDLAGLALNDYAAVVAGVAAASAALQAVAATAKGDAGSLLLPGLTTTTGDLANLATGLKGVATDIAAGDAGSLADAAGKLGGAYTSLTDLMTAVQSL